MKLSTASHAAVASAALSSPDDHAESLIKKTIESLDGDEGDFRVTMAHYHAKAHDREIARFSRNTVVPAEIVVNQQGDRFTAKALIFGNQIAATSSSYRSEQAAIRAIRQKLNGKDI